jgi:inorganic pyrophosphatase
MKTVTAIVETPKGSAQKYDYDKKNKWFELKKIMPAGMVFPFDFGFIPATKGEDGDPLDIIIISELKSFPGCAMECRIIGGILAEQTEKKKTVRNDRFLAIPVASQIFADVKSIEDLPKDVIDQLQSFFINYNEEAGKKFKPIKNVNAKDAYKLIKSN